MYGQAGENGEDGAVLEEILQLTAVSLGIPYDEVCRSMGIEPGSDRLTRRAPGGKGGAGAPPFPADTIPAQERERN